MRGRRQELRNNATPHERKLWFYLKSKKLGFLFYRQHSIGPYVVDFYCPKRKLILELDGKHHIYEEQYDTERTRFFTGLGFDVVRFWNFQIDIALDEVLFHILMLLETTTPDPSLEKEGR